MFKNNVVDGQIWHVGPTLGIPDLEDHHLEDYTYIYVLKKGHLWYALLNERERAMKHYLLHYVRTSGTLHSLLI